MGGSEKSSRSSRDGGGHSSSRGHSSKDKGKGKEIAGKGKAKVSQTIPEDDLLPSSLPASSTLKGAGEQFGSQYPQEDDGSQQQPPSYSNYSQSAPAQQIAYSSYYDSVPTQQQSHGYSREPQQEDFYPLASNANYVATPARLEDQISGLRLNPPLAENNRYTHNANAAIQGQYSNTMAAYAVVGTSPSGYATQKSQGGHGKSSRTRSHGSATNTKAQNHGYGERGAQKLLGRENFKKHPSKDFALGRVLKIFWFEPLGGNAMQNQHNGTINTRGSYVGEQLQQAMNQRGKIRRFVIIETRKGHSTAVPIHTYNYQGTLKPGCHPADHAMIYTNPLPNYLPGEDGIPHQPLRMAAVAGEVLAPESRINFAKKYTIEHNFLVTFIGQIAKNSFNDFWMTLETVNESQQLFLPPTPRAGPSAPMRIPGSSGDHQASIPRSSQLPNDQQTPLASQAFDESGNPLTAQAADESYGSYRNRDLARTPTSSQPSTSRRSDRDYRDNREPRERRYRY